MMLVGEGGHVERPVGRTPDPERPAAAARSCDDDVERRAGFRRLPAVACLAADLEARLLEDAAQVEADDRLVLGDQNSHRSRSAGSTSASISLPTTSSSANGFSTYE